MLVKLHDVFRDKILEKVESKVTTCLYSDESSQFQELVCKNDEEFERYVEKFQFELSELMDRSNAATAALNLKRYYPVTLPYTKFVVDILNHLTDLVNTNLDYWQFLLNDMRDFTLVSNSCDEILLKACGVIYEYIETDVFSDVNKKYSLL